MTDRRGNMIRRRRRQQKNNYHLPIAMIIATTALLLLSLSISTASATTTTNQVLRGARRRIQSTTNTHSRNLKKKTSSGDGDETSGLFAHKQNRIDPTTGLPINNTSKKHKKTKTHIDKEGRLVDINGNLLDKKGRQITLPERCKKPKELMKVEEKELKEQLKQAEKEAQKNKEQQKPAVVPFGEVGDIKEQREDATTTGTTEVKKTSSSVDKKKKGSPLSSPPAPTPPSSTTPFLQTQRSIDPITGEWKPPHTSSPITQAEAEAIQLAAELAEQAAIEAAAEGYDVFGGSLGGEGTSLEELQGTVISNSMCDEEGNLLPSYTSFSPTVTPPLDEGDTDNDGLLNWQEDELGTNKNNVDSDGDGLTDSQEIILGTDPLNIDSDGDGVDDYTELMDGTNPLDASDFIKKDLVDGMDGADNDGDGLFNEQEIELGTDVDNSDTDGDGLSDGMEVIYQQTDPLRTDTDSDGLSDYEEVMIHGTNPNNPDSDGDGYSDGFEISQNLDPLVPNDYTTDPLAISPGCESYLNNTVYVTSIPAAIDLEYEISIDESTEIDIVNEQMERVMAKLIGETLINCGQLSSDSEQVGVNDDGAVRRARRTRSLLTSRHLLVDGIDPSPKDIILTKKTCSYYTADNTDTPSNSKCYVIKSLSKLYLREDNAQSSPLHSSQQALRILLDAMNSPSPSPFLESSGDGDYSVEGVKEVRYIMGTPDEGGVLLIDNSGGSGLNNGEGIDGAQEADTNSDKDGSLDPLSPVGITLIVLGCVGILAIALVAGRNICKRKDNGQKKSLQYAEFYDDENDLDIKHHGLDDDDKFTDRDASSLYGTPSPKRSRRDHREDDSIFSGLESPGNETNLDPAFIHTRTSNHNRDDGSQSQITAEKGYEAGGMQFYPRDPFPRSKYEPKVQVESPKYENPAGMKQPPERNGRVYHVGDTVEF